MSIIKINLILIDSNLKDTDILLASINTQTCALLYNYDTSRHDLLQQIEEKFGNGIIERVSICCHEGVTSFLENKTFFDIADNVISPNDNTRFVIDLLTGKNISNIDFLACNSLKHPEWKKYYDLIENEVKSVTVGASHDATGNLKYGGNWLMENTGENIGAIYFNEGLEYYMYLLNNITYAEITNVAHVNKENRDNSTHVKYGGLIQTITGYYHGGTNTTTRSLTIMSNSTGNPHNYNTVTLEYWAFRDTNINHFIVEFPSAFTGYAHFSGSSLETIYVKRIDYLRKSIQNPIMQTFNKIIYQDDDNKLYYIDVSSYTYQEAQAILITTRDTTDQIEIPKITNITPNLTTFNKDNITITFTKDVSNEIDIANIDNYLKIKFQNNTSTPFSFQNMSLDESGTNLTGTLIQDGTIASYPYVNNIRIYFNYESLEIPYITLDALPDLSIEISLNILPPPPTLDLFTIDPSNITVENPGAIIMTFSNSVEEVDVSNSLTIDPTDAGTITNISGSETFWTATLVPNYGLNLTDCSLNFDHAVYGINQTKLFNVETYIQEIKSITLTPDNIITDLSSNLEVVLRVPSDIEPTISIDPSYIAILHGNMTSSDNGLTWNGTINRTLDMNLLGNTLTVISGDISSNIAFDAYDEQYFTPEQELYNFCTYVKIEKPRLENTDLTFLQLEFYDFNDNQITDGTISSSNQLNNHAAFAPSYLTDNDLSKIGPSFFGATSNQVSAHKWFKYTFSNSIRLKKIKIYERYSYGHNSQTYNLAVKNINATVSIYNDSNIIHTWNTFSGSSGAVYEIVMPTYIEPKYISRQLSSQITLDPSNIEYPNTTSNFQINFTTNDKTLDDISGNVSLNSTVSNINRSSLLLSNYGYRLEGNIVAQEYSSDTTNKLSYIETNDISGESVNYNINTNPTFELIECTLTPSNLVGTDVSGVLRMEFNTPLPDTTNLNNYITLDPSYIATLGTMSYVSGGFIWEGVLERSQNMNKLGNKIDFDYSYNGVEVSANLEYDVLENNNLLKWEKKTDTSLNEIFDRRVKISPNGQKLALIRGDNVRIYYLSGSTWSLESEISGNLLALCDNRIAISTDVSLQIYEYNNEIWNPIGNYINAINIHKLDISNDGNRVAFVYDISSVDMYEYSSDGWTQSTSIQSTSIQSTGDDVKFSPNGLLLGVGTLDSVNHNFSNVVLYEKSSSVWTI